MTDRERLDAGRLDGSATTVLGAIEARHRQRIEDALARGIERLAAAEVAGQAAPDPRDAELARLRAEVATLTALAATQEHSVTLADRECDSAARVVAAAEVEREALRAEVARLTAAAFAYHGALTGAIAALDQSTGEDVAAERFRVLMLEDARRVAAELPAAVRERAREARVALAGELHARLTAALAAPLVRLRPGQVAVQWQPGGRLGFGIGGGRGHSLEVDPTPAGYAWRVWRPDEARGGTADTLPAAQAAAEAAVGVLAAAPLAVAD